MAGPGRPALKKEPAEPGDIQFFSEIDMNSSHPDSVGSTYPAWYFTESMRQLEDSIEQEKRELKMFNMPESTKPVKVAKIKKMEERLERIKESKGLLKPNTDKLSVFTNELGEKLREIMPSRSDERKGYVDAHDIAEHWTTPCIEVSGELARVAMNNGFQVQKKGNGGKMTELEVARFWKLGRKALGEDTNLERLRRD